MSELSLPLKWRDVYPQRCISTHDDDFLPSHILMRIQLLQCSISIVDCVNDVCQGRFTQICRHCVGCTNITETGKAKDLTVCLLQIDARSAYDTGKTPDRSFRM